MGLMALQGPCYTCCVSPCNILAARCVCVLFVCLQRYMCTPLSIFHIRNCLLPNASSDNLHLHCLAIRATARDEYLDVLQLFNHHCSREQSTKNVSSKQCTCPRRCLAYDSTHDASAHSSQNTPDHSPEPKSNCCVRLLFG